MTKKIRKFKIAAFALCVAVFGSVIGFTACEGGAAGTAGKSAYDIWLEQGNTGTEQDFLDSLKGDKGDPGETPEIKVGVNGNWFVDGVDTGVKAQGDQGDPGAKGKDGPSWFTGNGCTTEFIDMTEQTTGSKTGDFYLCAECGKLWRKTGTNHWDQIATLKGPKGDKGDPGESGGGNVDDDTFKLNVSAGEKADMPITDLPAGTYVVEVALDQKIDFGRLEASVESSVTSYSSVFAFSQKRTDEAGDGSQVYYGYVIVAEGDLKLTFAPTADLRMQNNATEIKDAKVSIKKWEQPTLKADGIPVEIILNNSNAPVDNVFKVNLDESVGEGSYKITVNRGLQLDSGDTLGVFDQTNNMGYGGQLVYLMGNETVKDITISASKNYLVFKPLIDLPQYHYLVPATVSLAKN